MSTTLVMLSFFMNGLSHFQSGLLRILAERLYNSRSLSDSDENYLLQHSVSLRSNLLTDQQYFQDTQNNQNIPIGWVSGPHDSYTTLINTETTASSVLGLSIGAK